MEVAIKEIPHKLLLEKMGEKGVEALNTELQVSEKLKHKNIVRFYDFLKTGNNNYMVLECCMGGDLSSYLKEKGRFSELVAHRFMKQIAEALKYMYQNSIVHRDLKL